MPAATRPFEGDSDDGEAVLTSPPSKIRRLALENFEKGAIIKIRVKNFMAYDEAEFRPGPHLNLVLAPNGTGKSSLTCALCLGLAGAPSILGRGENVKAFIKHGQSEAMTEVTLSSGNPARPVVIRRTYHRDGTSNWRINGAQKNAKEAKEIMKDMNVQLDNLCQFLPQDRVVAFAQMKPVELLRESERAMGDAHLSVLHDELSVDSRALLDFQRSAGALQRKLAEEEALMAELQRDKDRFQKRRNLEEQVELLANKELWLDVQAAQDRVKQTNKNLDDAKKRLETLEREIAQRDAPIREREEEEKTIYKQVQELKRKGGLAEKALHTLNDELIQRNDLLTEKWEAMDGLQEAARRQAAALANAEATVAKAQADLDQHPALEPRLGTPDMHTLQQECREHTTELRRAEIGIDELTRICIGWKEELGRCQSELQRINSVKTNKLRLLERERPGITAFTEWIQANQGQFRGRVYGPILLEVSVPDPQQAKYLEMHFGRNFWLRFVTEYMEDQDTLRSAARQFRFSPTITNFTANANTPLTHPDKPASHYGRQPRTPHLQWGITHTLDEVFEAEPIIKRVMNDDAAITRAFICAPGKDASAALQANPSLRTLYSPESRYSVRGSAYNPDARSEQVRAIPGELRWLGGAQDNKEEQDRLNRDTAEKRQGLTMAEDERAAMIADMQRLDQVVKAKQAEQKKLAEEVAAHKRARAKLEAALKMRQRQLDTERRKPDPMKQEPVLKREIDRLVTEAATKMAALLAAYKTYWAGMREHICLEARWGELMAQITALKSQNQQVDQEKTRLLRLKEQLREIKRADGAALKRAFDKAVEVTGPYVEELEAKFRALPQDREELHAEMERLTVEAAGIACANPRVMQEYQERSARIANLRVDFGRENDVLQAASAALQEKKERWLPELQEMVGIINTHFSRHLRAMGCNGQVSLSCGCEGGFDGCAAFDKYAIHIRVKFRDEEALQLLSATRQSGGERAITTILYIMALQNVTVCPFRVVDEINQGMDQINERKVFALLVQAACHPGTPQCFMFTPKLLPDLPYTPDVMPMLILNGAHMADVSSACAGADSFIADMPVVCEG